MLDECENTYKMVYTPYIWPLIIAFILCIRIALYTMRYRDTHASRSFIIMMWLGAAWTLIYALSIVIVWYPLRVFLSMVMYIPTRLITPVILLMAVEYSGNDHLLTRRNISLSMAIPIISILASLTSYWHTLFRYNFNLDTSGPLPILHYDSGIIYIISIIYGPVLVFIALGMMFMSLWDKTLRPNSTLLLILGILIPVVVEILFAFGISPIEGYNFAPSTIICTGGAYLLALMRYRLFSFAPIARSTVFENISDVVVVFDTRGRIIDCNSAGLEQIGLNKKNFLGTQISSLPKVWEEFFDRSVQEGEGRRECSIDVDSKKRIFDVSMRRIFDARMRYVGLVYLLHEITDLRSSEQRIKQLLTDKELLLREVHHRIKNNMSVIASILSLQSDRVTDPAAKMALQDAKGRVHSMMVLYERLYRSDCSTNLSIDAYLGSLIDKIMCTLGDPSRMTIHKDIGDFILGSRLLFSVGIIVNELITNAIKHAFMDGQNGSIYITAASEADRVSIVVEDDGACFPEDIDSAMDKGFGLQMVQLMAKQINASFSVERIPRTRFTLAFSI